MLICNISKAFHRKNWIDYTASMCIKLKYSASAWGMMQFFVLYLYRIESETNINSQYLAE